MREQDSMDLRSVWFSQLSGYDRDDNDIVLAVGAPSEEVLSSLKLNVKLSCKWFRVSYEGYYY